MPQHTKRVKIRRKDLRKPDEFETLTGQVVDWAGAHRPLVIALAAAVVAVAVIALAVGRWRAGRTEAAAVAFRSAQAQFEAARYADAAGAFAEVAGTHPHTPFGRLAGLYRGHALARAGEAAAAATAYTEYLATSPDSEYLRQEALTGLARAQEATGDTAGALDTYTQAGDLRGPYRTDALLGAARLLETSGRVEQAHEIYTRLLKDAADPETRALLMAKLPPGSRPAEPPADSGGD
jgi:tetratricopeptide (TPR) repeat protein